jgi:rhodanese-related sulfurtransferase
LSVKEICDGCGKASAFPLQESPNEQRGLKVIKKVFLSGMLLLSLSIVSAFAAFPEIPRISNEELKKLIEAKEKVVILDTQPKEVYDAGHIKGAISFPWKEEYTQDDVAGLPVGELIVTYCDCGPGESDSAFVANQLLQLGFGTVKVLGEPGIRGWKKSNYPME